MTYIYDFKSIFSGTYLFFRRYLNSKFDKCALRAQYLLKYSIYFKGSFDTQEIAHVCKTGKPNGWTNPEKNIIFDLQSLLLFSSSV